MHRCPEIDGRGCGSRDEVLARTEGIVRRQGRPRRRVPPEEGVDALGEGGREQDVGRATFECAAEDRPLGADGIQDHRQIRDSGLEVGGGRHCDSKLPFRDGHARSDARTTRGRGTTPRTVGTPRSCPRSPTNRTARRCRLAVAHRLIGDVDAVGGLGVSSLTRVHARILPRTGPRRNRSPPE